MADLKISQLPNASTPLAGTEVLPIVQAGVTDKVTVDNLLARLTAAPPAIGTTTPAAGSFTTLTTSGNAIVGGSALVTAAAGLGYGTGAGGTVTQATSKSTTVTLNKPSGQITMNNAALGAGGVVSFQLTNSLIAATDVVIAMPIGTFSSYRVDTFPFAGGVVMRVTNYTGGSLSEAAVINFAVIKGVTS